ncbi:hypothetical protein DFJ73DRAFT_785514 [Zopfochytrium polystomum]|nr:hypothetical protein DFJ73DRAFT_785514 [Zopfochytrium polystomum]
MTEPERATTLRVLAKRNKDRLARLQASQEGASPATGAGAGGQQQHDVGVWLQPKWLDARLD